MDIYAKILQAQKENKIYAVATVVQTEGSVSRSPGAKMLVYGNGEVAGSVGGGSVEQQTVLDCLAAMKTGEISLKTYNNTGDPEGGMVCGSKVTVFIEPGKQLPYLYLCGCGHVAQAVLPLAKALGYYVVCFDARDISAFQGCLKDADELHVLDSFEKLRDMELISGASFIVCSYSHKTDGDILEAVLKKAPGYVGMLGGKPKIKALFKQLRVLGYSEELLRRIHAPIGLDLGGETPAEVALSIMSQVQAVRYGKTGQAMDEQLRDIIFPL